MFKHGIGEHPVQDGNALLLAGIHRHKQIQVVAGQLSFGRPTRPSRSITLEADVITR